MHRTTVRTTVVTAGLAGAAALVVAAPALADSVTRAAGELTRYTYAEPVAATVPEGATARVQSVETADGKTIMTLHVSGMQPFAQYGAHAHVHACGPTGGAAGGHFQWDVDPVQPSVDPAFANPQNEIWLDLTTNRAGEGSAKAVVDRPFPSGRRPGSVIIHEKHTSPANGTAGKRVACLTIAY